MEIRDLIVPESMAKSIERIINRAGDAELVFKYKDKELDKIVVRITDRDGKVDEISPSF